MLLMRTEALRSHAGERLSGIRTQARLTPPEATLFLLHGAGSSKMQSNLELLRDAFLNSRGTSSHFCPHLLTPKAPHTCYCYPVFTPPSNCSFAHPLSIREPDSRLEPPN